MNVQPSPRQVMALEYIAAAAAGAASHLYYFNLGEHHFYGATYVQIFVAAFVAGAVVLCQLGESKGNALAHVTPIAAFYLIGLYTSLFIYRSLFHPLNGIPGPFGARITNLWLSAQLKDGDAFRKVHKLHEHYGDFVRIGSSDLSITHPKAVNAIYGVGSMCTKAAWYDITWPMLSMQTLRTKALHDQRRHIWSPAFSDKALRGYEERIRKHRNKLIDQIGAFNDQPFDMSKWFKLYSFDVMGDLAFGTSFKMLEASEEHWAIKLLNEGMDPLSFMFPEWFFRLMAAVPGLMANWWKFIGYCALRVDDRMRVSHSGCLSVQVN